MKLLVANRSEIACRIFQACREMGITSVALVAPGDENARHVTFADEVIEVSSYLDPSAIVTAAVKAGVTMIHPGYGFLSERAVFAESVEKAGMTFIGPTAQTMEMMGGKIAAKELAASIGVPTLPWAKVKDGEDLAKTAQSVGYPLLLKAAAGGGGKGMRRVNQSADFASAAESAAAEAKSAFGDSTLFLERLVDEPRHIEIQVFGDGKGGAVHLFERECSLQRKHQKVFEEAPAPNLPEKTKAGLIEAALKLTQHVKYRSAGTLEFLVDKRGEFFFLEMNTRLQVEHPVTELVTGLDLVIAQIELALGRKDLMQVTATRGHAIEVRIYAEDPYQGFMPTPGRVERLKWPTGPGIRVDSGIEEGQEVGTSFDSMLAKLIVFGRDRKHALARMRFALEETVIFGIGTNIPYLKAIASHSRVESGDVYTQFLDKEFDMSVPKPISEELGLLTLGLQGQFGSTAVNSNPAVSILGASPWVTIKGAL